MKTRIIQDEPEASTPSRHVGPPEKRKPRARRAPNRRRVLAWFTRRIRSFESSGFDAFAAHTASRIHGGNS